jgi:adenylyltransferase/sulfurtransferase
MEVIKLITGIGTTLQGELLSMNLDTMQFRKVRLPKRDDCAVCAAR